MCGDSTHFLARGWDRDARVEQAASSDRDRDATTSIDRNEVASHRDRAPRCIGSTWDRLLDLGTRAARVGQGGTAKKVLG
jgi:hypothetical protein